MIFPEVAVNLIVRVTASPPSTATEPNPKVVSPAAVALVCARSIPLTDKDACAVTAGSGSICTRARSIEVTPAGTDRVCRAVPPGIDSGRAGLPRHIACPAACCPQLSYSVTCRSGEVVVVVVVVVTGGAEVTARDVGGRGAVESVPVENVTVRLPMVGVVGPVDVGAPVVRVDGPVAPVDGSEVRVAEPVVRDVVVDVVELLGDGPGGLMTRVVGGTRSQT